MDRKLTWSQNVESIHITFINTFKCLSAYWYVCVCVCDPLKENVVANTVLGLCV